MIKCIEYLFFRFPLIILITLGMNFYNCSEIFLGNDNIEELSSSYSFQINPGNLVMYYQFEENLNDSEGSFNLINYNNIDSSNYVSETVEVFDSYCKFK